MSDSKPVRILFLSYYFIPDLTVGAFRSSQLIEYLSRKLPVGSRLDIVTTQPNRYKSYTLFAPCMESYGAVSVKRIQVPKHKNGFIDQAASFLVYAGKTIRTVKYEQYDLVFATSSRLMTAMLGSYISRKLGAAFYLDIRDIFADTMKSLYPGLLFAFPVWLISKFEPYAVRRAKKVNLVSNGFKDYFYDRYTDLEVSCFTNCIDPMFEEKIKNTGQVFSKKGEKLKIVYAGNIGYGQALNKIIIPLAEILTDKAEFIVIGGGGKKPILEDEVKNKRIHNVIIKDPVSRDKLFQQYKVADVLFLHVDGLPAFERVLPSKIFEYATLGKPILAGVSGYAKIFIERNVENAFTFNPCDVSGALNALGKIKLEYTDRKDFVKKYSCKNVMSRMAADILTLMDPQ